MGKQINGQFNHVLYENVKQCMSNFSRFKDNLDLEYISVLWRRHTLKLRLTIWGKSASYICSHTIICHRGPPRLPLSLTEGLADRLLAIRRDCPCKIKFVCGGSADNVNSALCHCTVFLEFTTVFGKIMKLKY